jgi:hypothetical protein
MTRSTAAELQPAYGDCGKMLVETLPGAAIEHTKRTIGLRWTAAAHAIDARSSTRSGSSVGFDTRLRAAPSTRRHHEKTP